VNFGGVVGWRVGGIFFEEREKFFAEKTPWDGNASGEEFFPERCGVRKKAVGDAELEEDFFEGEDEFDKGRAMGGRTVP